VANTSEACQLLITGDVDEGQPARCSDVRFRKRIGNVRPCPGGTDINHDEPNYRRKRVVGVECNLFRITVCWPCRHRLIDIAPIEATEPKG